MHDSEPGRHRAEGLEPTNQPPPDNLLTNCIPPALSRLSSEDVLDGDRLPLFDLHLQCHQPASAASRLPCATRLEDAHDEARHEDRRQESVWLWGSDETTSPRVGDVLLAMPEPDSTVDGSVGAQQRHLHLHLQWQSGADCFHDPCDATPWCARDDADRDTPRDMPNDPEGRSRSSGALGYASPVPSTPPAPLSSTSIATMREDSFASAGSTIIARSTEQTLLGRENLDCAFERYLLAHCHIRAVDLKPNALARLHDLRELLQVLEAQAIVRCICTADDEASPTVTTGGKSPVEAAGRRREPRADARKREATSAAARAATATSRPLQSIFGFTTLVVDEIGDFNEAITRMVGEDMRRCWHANGRRILSSPTSTVYEFLRQLGVHPVKGTRGCPAAGAPIGGRDFMLYRQYKFDGERLLRNCQRLKIGVIGNRRS